MTDELENVCPQPVGRRGRRTAALAPPIELASVYECLDTRQASAALAGESGQYAYRRDGHPNADLLAEKCRTLHAAEQAAVTSSGMSALAVALVSQLKAGDHVLVSNQLYGRTTQLFTHEAHRLGIASTLVDTCNLAATRAAALPSTRMLLVETISNPLLRVSDVAGLADIAQAAGATLVVDNTLAGPMVCRPLESGADLVVESLTKSISGHSDVVLGLICGRDAVWERVATVIATWGLTSAPLDCWLALRGIGTMAIRMRCAMRTAQTVAVYLAAHEAVEHVHFPGLADHPDHALARRQFGETFGAMVTFTLRGGAEAADRFIAAADKLPFCPSLGEVCTTLTHPASTSHRLLPPDQQAALGIHPGTIRLSVGIESADYVTGALGEGLAAVKPSGR